MSRFLFVTNISPWNPISGISLRAATTLLGLRQLADTDVCLIVPNMKSVTATADEPSSRQLISAARPSMGRRADAMWFLTSRSPRSMYRMDRAEFESEFYQRFPGRYDLTWCMHAPVEHMLRRVVTGKVIFDLPDLEFRKVRGRSTVRISGAPRQITRRVAARKVERGWRRYYQSAADRLDSLIVCSELDRERLGYPNVRVVPNVYRRPEFTPREDVRRPDRFRIGFVGLMSYGPNFQGANWLAREVFPSIRTVLPEAELLLIGGESKMLQPLNRIPGVTVTGFVESISDLLRTIDVLTVPVHFGSGTRLKALEALAHRIPLVGTTIGLEGLKIVHGRHALIADTAEEFASALLHLHRDKNLATSLASAGHRLYEERYTPEVASLAIADVVKGVLPGEN